MADSRQVLIRALPGLPEVRAGDDVAALILDALARATWTCRDGDLVVVAHKIISKAEGRVIPLDKVTPGEEARALARELNKDPRKIEVILGETERVVRRREGRAPDEGLLICRHPLGLVSANAGVDESNVPGEDRVALLPLDPDRSAASLRATLEAKTKVRLGVIITDTFGRPWRRGLVNVAIGLAGPPALLDYAGRLDTAGRPLRATLPALADEIAAAAGLLMEKTAAVPVVLLRGLSWQESRETARDLVRAEEEDLFLQ